MNDAEGHARRSATQRADSGRSEPSKQQLLEMDPSVGFDTERLKFTGLRGNPRFHLPKEELLLRLRQLPPPHREAGHVTLLLARGPGGTRKLPDQVHLTVEGGMPGDRWGAQDKFDQNFQLATTHSPYAEVIANGQPLELHGDNLFITLDVSKENLPPGARLSLGEAELTVTPQAHNGCKKWVQRFGLAPMQLNLDPEYEHLRLRGIYLRVTRDGLVRRGDAIRVLERPSQG